MNTNTVSSRLGGGFLLPNDHKTADNQPDYTGRVEVLGTDYRIAGWVKKGADGRTMVTLKVTDMPPVVVAELLATETRAPAIPQGEP